MRITRRTHLTKWFSLVGLVALPAAPVAASEIGQLAASRVSEDSFRHYLDDMLYTHDGDDRGLDGPEHDLAQANIFTILSTFGLTVTLEPFDLGGDTYYNVVGTKLGSTYPDQEYIVGAHYDSVGNPGADDNASGVALVLEAARVLSTYDSDYTIRFIAFDAEEWGLVGSEAYVLDHIEDDILGMISADMVSYNTGAYSVDIFGHSASSAIKTALAQAVATYGDGLGSSQQGPLDASDHAPFEWYGFQACLLIEDWGNPYYHTSADSVDTPDYIDYGYATQITRVAVGYLVDHAGISVDADYDGDGDVDMDDYTAFEACFTGPDIPPGDPDCDFFDFDQDEDVDCADWNHFAGAWTGPGDLPVFGPCMDPPPFVAGEGGRCVAVTAPEYGNPMALLVTGDPVDPAVSCVSHYVQEDGQLGSTPVFLSSAEWGTVFVCDERIIPGTSYTVQCDYGAPGSPVLSSDVIVTTAIWGDTVGDFIDGEWTPHNGVVDFRDISSVVDAFKHWPTAPPLYWADLVGASDSRCIPDLSIDFLDISAAVDAFKGYTYWETTGCSVLCDWRQRDDIPDR